MGLDLFGNETSYFRMSVRITRRQVRSGLCRWGLVKQLADIFSGNATTLDLHSG